MQTRAFELVAVGLPSDVPHMNATKILWGQILLVSLVVLAFDEDVCRFLEAQPALGPHDLAHAWPGIAVLVQHRVSPDCDVGKLDPVAADPSGLVWPSCA
jgi:hypothetical protein